MSIRHKYFLFLLLVSLGPLAVVSLYNVREGRRLGETLAEESKVELSRLVSLQLQRGAERNAKIIERSGPGLKILVELLGDKARTALAGPVPQNAPILESADFNDQAKAPAAKLRPDYAVKFLDASSQPLVSFERMLVHYGPGADKATQDAAAKRLGTLLPDVQRLWKDMRGSLYRLYFSLPGGGLLAYPGQSGFPKEYDARTRPWFNRATVGEEAGFTEAYRDAASGRWMISGSKAFVGGGQAPPAVVGVDVLLDVLLSQEGIRRDWDFGGVRSIIAQSAAAPGDAKPHLALRIQYERSQASGEDVEGGGDLGRLDAFTEARIMRDIATPGLTSGSGEALLNGLEYYLGWSEIAEGLVYLLAVPREAVRGLPESQFSRVIDAAGRVWIASASAGGAALLVVAMLAAFGANTSIKPIMRLAQAARRLRDGDFTTRIDVYTNDERDELVHAFNEMAPRLKEQMRMTAALETARDVQMSLLPRTAPDIPGVDAAGAGVYSDETGGDYFDYFKPNGVDSLLVSVGDVSGHGVSAALVMAGARAFLRSAVDQACADGRIKDLGGAVSKMNRLLCRDTAEKAFFITMFCLEITGDGEKLRWVRCGHDPALVYDPSRDAFDEYGGEGMLLGVVPDLEWKSFDAPRPNPGGIVCIGTDGIWESRNADNEMYGKERLKDVIRAHRTDAAQGIVEAVFADVARFRGDFAQEDDVTLVIVKFV